MILKIRHVWIGKSEVISNAVSGEHTDLIDAATMLDWSLNITNAYRDVPLRRQYKYFYDDGPGVVSALEQR